MKQKDKHIFQQEYKLTNIAIKITLFGVTFPWEHWHFYYRELVKIYDNAAYCGLKFTRHWCVNITILLLAYIRHTFERVLLSPCVIVTILEYILNLHI